MKMRKIRVYVLLAAATALPAAGYLMGFTKAQTGEGDDWSAAIAVNHELLSPLTAGVMALQHGKELELSGGERDSILKVLRADAPGLLKAQRARWGRDVRKAQKLLSGEEIITEFSIGVSQRNRDVESLEDLELAHLGRVEQIIGKRRWAVLFNIRDRKLADLQRATLFLLLRGDKANELRLSDRQKNQFARLASYQAMVVKVKNLYGYDGDYETLPIHQAMRMLETASDSQIVYFTQQAEDFLDPIQLLQLKALTMDRFYVPIP
jgi:hypothetical protein